LVVHSPSPLPRFYIDVAPPIPPLLPQIFKERNNHHLLCKKNEANSSGYLCKLQSMIQIGERREGREEMLDPIRWLIQGIEAKQRNLSIKKIIYMV
jgi:hypothetical protein